MLCSVTSVEYAERPAGAGPDPAAGAPTDGALPGAGCWRPDRSTAPGRLNGCCVMRLILGTPRCSETRRLPILAPLGAERVADLAEGRLDTTGLEHRLDHVPVGAADLDHVLHGPLRHGVVARRTTCRELAHLLDLNLVRDPKDLQVVGDRVGVDVDADDLLVALLQRGLVLEGGLGDLGHEPAVLDAPQEALRDGVLSVAG